MSRSSAPEPPSFSARLRASGAGETLPTPAAPGHQSGQLRAGEQRLVQLIARFNEYPAAVALHRYQRDTGPAQCVDVALDGAARHLKPLRQRGHGAFFGLQQDRDDADETVDLHRVFLKKRPAGGRAILRPAPPRTRQLFPKDLRASAQRAHLAVQLFVHAGAHPFLGGGLHGFVQHEPAHAAVLVGFARSASPASASSR